METADPLFSHDTEVKLGNNTPTIEDRVRHAEEASRRVWDNLKFPKPGIEDHVRYGDSVGTIALRREGMMVIRFGSDIEDDDTLALVYAGELYFDRKLAGGLNLWEWRD